MTSKVEKGVGFLSQSVMVPIASGVIFAAANELKNKGSVMVSPDKDTASRAIVQGLSSAGSFWFTELFAMIPYVGNFKEIERSLITGVLTTSFLTFYKYMEQKEKKPLNFKTMLYLFLMSVGSEAAAGYGLNAIQGGVFKTIAQAQGGIRPKDSVLG